LECPENRGIPLFRIAGGNDLQPLYTVNQEL